MPLEIRELIIKAKIEDESEFQDQESDYDLRDLVEDCVDQVLEILKKESDR